MAQSIGMEILTAAPRKCNFRTEYNTCRLPSECNTPSGQLLWWHDAPFDPLRLSVGVFEQQVGAGRSQSLPSRVLRNCFISPVIPIPRAITTVSTPPTSCFGHTLSLNNPQPFNTTWSESRNGTHSSPPSIGYRSNDCVLDNLVSADCLTINVIRPGGVAAGANVPVALWIHDGDLVEEGAANPR